MNISNMTMTMLILLSLCLLSDGRGGSSFRGGGSFGGSRGGSSFGGSRGVQAVAIVVVVDHVVVVLGVVDYVEKVEVVAVEVVQAEEEILSPRYILLIRVVQIIRCIVVEENNDNLLQLLDSRGGSHVTNVLAFDKDDVTSWKIRFLVFLDGLEPYLITTLEDGLFVPMSNLSSPTNPLLKRQNQWSNTESRLANQDKRLKSIIIGCLPNDVIKSVIKYKSAKQMWTELCLAYEGPSDTRDTKIATLRLKFNAFKALKGEKVNGTYTRLKCLLNDLKNNGIIISQSKVNATFVNSLPRKWLSMNQTQRANNSIKNDSVAALYGKYHYEEDSDSDVEEDNITNNEFMAELNAEYHKRALLANQKRFYKRIVLSNKTSTPLYPSSNISFNKSKPYTPSFTPNISQNSSNHQKDYKGKYKGLKAEMAVLSQRIDELTKGKDDKGKGDKGKSDKGLVAESFDWDDESVSLEDEWNIKFKAIMEITEDEPSVGKDSGCSRYMTGVKQYMHRFSKEFGLKVVFGDNSSGDIEGYSSVNCNGITFTKLVRGKQHRATFTTKRSFSINKCLHLLYIDLFGPVKPQTISHKKYTLVIVDEYSRYTWVYCLKKKSDASDCIMSFIRQIENLNDTKVKQLRSDNGTEFKNHTLEAFCDEKGILQNISSPCTPEQNGVAERRNRTLIEAARTMLNNTCTDSEPLEKVQNDTGYNVFANDLQHFEQSESISNTCIVETNDSNVIPDSPDMCDDDIQNDQNDVECDDDRVALANLIANLKLDVDENKII
nr:putative ribonuclease H-like domain-containing protein [Tanacetum cinerariifolium]